MIELLDHKPSQYMFIDICAWNKTLSNSLWTGSILLGNASQ